MELQLIDVRTADGSRVFLRLPLSIAGSRLVARVARLPEAAVINNLVESGWFDFLYGEHRFLVRTDGRHWLLSVDDPRMSDVLLFRVARAIAGDE
ncbi:MAG: hypothetical protein ACOY3P_04530 [Planctomycetota bacterium]